MRHKSKLKLVHDTGNTAQPISALSPDEQARLLDLADRALHNKKPDDDKLIPGDRAHAEHELLKRELKEAVERFDKSRDGAA